MCAGGGGGGGKFYLFVAVRKDTRRHTFNRPIHMICIGLLYIDLLVYFRSLVSKFGAFNVECDL